MVQPGGPRILRKRDMLADKQGKPPLAGRLLGGSVPLQAPNGSWKARLGIQTQPHPALFQDGGSRNCTLDVHRLLPHSA